MKYCSFETLLAAPTRNGIYKKKEFHGRGVKIVNMGELFSYARLFGVPMKRVELTERELEKSGIRAGDLLFARRSLVAEGAGKCSIVMEVNEPTTFESSIIRARLDLRMAEPLYYYYFFSSPQGRETMQTILRQVAVAGITGTDLVQLIVPCPSLADQQAIAAVLGALDDKIELNRRICATLDAMARTLFRSWFVDFDPVRAKAEGQAPAHMDAATAALFPDRFGNDGLPEGWRWRAMDFYAVLETGKRPKGGVARMTSGVPSIGAESIKSPGHFDYSKTKWVSHEFFSAMKKGMLEDGDVLVYKDGGKPGQLRPAVTLVSEGFPFKTCCINEHVFRVRLDDRYGQGFLYCVLSSDHCMSQMRELATGVAQPGLNQSAMKALTSVLPDDRRIMMAFDGIARRWLDLCNTRARECQVLATLRDTLLPKLMSGQLRVREAERQLSEAV